MSPGESRTATISLLLASCIMSFLAGCGDDPTAPDPDLPDFFLAWVLFTGDSVGTPDPLPGLAAATTVSDGSDQEDPYCEVTVSWHPPDEDRGLVYSVLRATTPGIWDGAADSSTVGSTEDTLLVDSDSLQWGVTYYYAVLAVDTDSTVLRSDEGSIGMPVSPLPTPSVLSADHLPLGECILHWTHCPDDDFRSYTLVSLENGQYSQMDTLCTFEGRYDTTFTHTDVPPDDSRWYMVFTRNERGYRAESNVLVYEPGFGLPWLADFRWRGPAYFDWYTIGSELLPSDDESCLYFTDTYYYEREDYVSFGLNRIRPSSSHVLRVSFGSDFRFTHVPGMNAVLTIHDGVIALRDEVMLHCIDTTRVDFELAQMAAFPEGCTAIVHPWGRWYSLLFDMRTMTLGDTLDYTFDSGRILGDELYVWGEGLPLSRVSSPSGELAATGDLIPEEDMFLSSDGVLFVVTAAGRMYELDPATLSRLGESALPYVPCEGAFFEVDGGVYVYLCEYNGSPVEIYRTDDMSLVGEVAMRDLGGYYIVTGMTTLPASEAIWTVILDTETGYEGLYEISD